jgi:hypothetical protein
MGRAMLRRPSVFSFVMLALLSVGARSAMAAGPADSDDDDDDTEGAPKKPPAPQPPADAGGAKALKKQAKQDDADAQGEPAEKPVEVEAPPALPQVEHPLTTTLNGWTATLYGFAELDIMGDTTQSFVEGSLNNTVQRPNTLAGDNPRLQYTARNSRLGFTTTAPEVNGIKATAGVEVDFFGNNAQTTTQTEDYASGPLRMRLFYLKLETSVVDVIAGQYSELFAWNGSGFYPNTPAFLPVLGEVYRRDPQLRVSKTLSTRAFDLEVAVAAVRPFDRDTALPDVQAGLRLTANGWTGARTSGASRPTIAPLAIGISALGRRLTVSDFSATPGNPQKANAGGIAVDVFLPIIPAHGVDMSNALSVSGELTYGTGIADMYPSLSGGVGFPQLPNPNNDLAVPTYIPNIDPGVATFDAEDVLHTVNWRMIVASAQYHLPFDGGRAAWISGTYSNAQSNNALELTPQAGIAYVWSKGQYADGTLWLGLTPAVQVGLSGQWTQQTFGDGVSAQNLRGEGSFYLFF